MPTCQRERSTSTTARKASSPASCYDGINVKTYRQSSCILTGGYGEEKIGGNEQGSDPHTKNDCLWGEDPLPKGAKRSARRGTLTSSFRIKRRGRGGAAHKHPRTRRCCSLNSVRGEDSRKSLQSCPASVIEGPRKTKQVRRWE